MSQTNNSETSKKNLESIVNGTNWVALCVVFVAVVGLIFVIFNLLSKTEKNNAPTEILIKYEISVDKVSLKNAKDSTTLRVVQSLDENNKKILNEINSSVDAQYKRMESILSVQEDRSRLFSYGAGFLAILVAIATFFGFKSINEMKKSTIEAAEYEAKKIAEEKAKEVAQSVAEEKTKEELVSRLDGIKAELYTSLTSDFQSKLDLRDLNVSDDFQNLIRAELDAKLNELREEIYSLSNTSTTELSEQTASESTNIVNEGLSSEESLYTDNDLDN